MGGTPKKHTRADRRLKENQNIAPYKDKNTARVRTSKITDIPNGGQLGLENLKIKRFTKLPDNQK